MKQKINKAQVERSESPHQITNQGVRKTPEPPGRAARSESSLIGSISSDNDPPRTPRYTDTETTESEGSEPGSKSKHGTSGDEKEEECDSDGTGGVECRTDQTTGLFNEQQTSEGGASESPIPKFEILCTVLGVEPGIWSRTRCYDRVRKMFPGVNEADLRRAVNETVNTCEVVSQMLMRRHRSFMDTSAGQGNSEATMTWIVRCMTNADP